MVRKMVAALREVDEGRLTADRLEAALHGRVRLTLPLAEPERLVLWDVEYPFPWQYRWAGPNRHQGRWLTSERENLWVRHALLEAFSSAGQPGTDPGHPSSESVRDER
jgi:hypothetical protein